MHLTLNLSIWLVYFIPALAIELMCFILAPLVACFVRSELRHDSVKRLGKRYVTIPRDYLITPLYWFQTHDNAVDEWWYGTYNTDHWFAFARNWTQADYDRSRFIRYYCRVMWLWRNCAYGFHYNLFSRPREREVLGQIYTAGVEGKGLWVQLDVYPSSFQLQCHVPLGNRYLSINIGWKAHRHMPRLLYANRIIGFRKY